MHPAGIHLHITHPYTYISRTHTPAYHAPTPTYHAHTPAYHTPMHLHFTLPCTCTLTTLPPSTRSGVRKLVRKHGLWIALKAIIICIGERARVVCIHVYTCVLLMYICVLLMYVLYRYVPYGIVVWSVYICMYVRISILLFSVSLEPPANSLAVT